MGTETGGIAQAHVEGYRAFPHECEIVALADALPGRAAEKTVAFGVPDAAAYDDPQVKRVFPMSALTPYLMLLLAMGVLG